MNHGSQRDFDRGIWSKLDKQVRQWAVDDNEVYVVTGAVLNKGLTTIGYDRISVPALFYKVILDYTEPDIIEHIVTQTDIEQPNVIASLINGRMP